jgi:hypothetical protein
MESWVCSGYVNAPTFFFFRNLEVFDSVQGEVLSSKSKDWLVQNQFPC